MERGPSYHQQAWTLLLDDACRQIVRHLESAGQPHLMLKGATIASWLYPDPAVRTYNDLDILVAPTQAEPVIGLLGRLGYRPLLDPRALRLISPEEQPLVDERGVTIDLHVAIKGIRLPADEAWAVLYSRAVSCQWAGTPVPALDPAARAMNLALHVAQLGSSDAKALQDLVLGLDRLDEGLWREAADLATRLDALETFTAGILLAPAGLAMVECLGLRSPSDTAVLMRSDSSVSRPAVALERLLATATWRERLSTGWAYLFPTASWLRHVDPLARTGPWGVAMARIRRPFRVLARATRALHERRRFRPGGSRG